MSDSFAQIPVGHRVIAVVSIANNVALVLGEGVFVGYEVPDASLYPHLQMFSDNHIANPRIDLHSEGTVWGCECWWGPVESMRKRLQSCEIRQITPEEMRKGVSPSKTASPGDYSSEDVQSL